VTRGQVTYGGGQAGPYAAAAQAIPRATIKTELLRLLPPRSPEVEALVGPSEEALEATQDRIGPLPPSFPRTQLPPWAVSQQGLSVEGGTPREQLQEPGVDAPGTAEGAPPTQQVST